MPSKKIFTDEENNELQCYLNAKGKAFISVGKPGDDIEYNGYITLDKIDVRELIEVLREIEEIME